MQSIKPDQTEEALSYKIKGAKACSWTRSSSDITQPKKKRKDVQKLKE